MSKHTKAKKKHIKRKTNRRVKTINRRTRNRRTRNRKTNNNRTKSRRYRKKYNMKGGNPKNSLIHSPILNKWYDLMNMPSNLLLTYDGVKIPNNMNSDPIMGHYQKKYI